MSWISAVGTAVAGFVPGGTTALTLIQAGAELVDGDGGSGAPTAIWKPTVAEVERILAIPGARAELEQVYTRYAPQLKSWPSTPPRHASGWLFYLSGGSDNRTGEAERALIATAQRYASYATLPAPAEQLSTVPPPAPSSSWGTSSGPDATTSRTTSSSTSGGLSPWMTPLLIVALLWLALKWGR